MEFALSEEQEDLVATVRTLLAKRGDARIERYDEALWSTLCEQIGVAALNVPEKYDGFGASGNLLGSVALPPQRTGNDCTGDPTGPLCNWTAAGVGFAGIAKSVEFEGPSGYFAFDDLAFGVAPPSGAVPEPATWALMLLGFGAIGGAMRRQRTRVAYA